MGAPPDPYRTLGVSAGVSDAELRVAYRRAVQRHHPDHNGGSAESARLFEEVQDAYARIRRLRARAQQPAGPGSDRSVDARLDEMERELAADRAARERAAKVAREREANTAHEREREREANVARRRERARAGGQKTAPQASSGESGKRPSDEELGYFKTDDSFSKILSDAASEVYQRLAAEENHVPKRLSDLIEELEARLRDSPER